MKTNLLLKNLLCGCLLFVMTNLSAQDNIIKKDGTEIPSKVMEVGDTYIKYKNFSNLNGPVYNIAIADVFMIMYENGEKDIFKTAQEEKKNAVSQPSSQNQQQPGNTLSANQQSSTVVPENSWRVLWGVDVAPAFTVLWIHHKDAKDMAGFGFMYTANVDIINHPSNVFFEFGLGGLLSNYGLSEGGTEMKMRSHAINFDVMLGQMSSSWYYKLGLRMGILVDAKASVGNGEFQPINSETLNSVSLGLPFEFGLIIASRVNLGLGFNFGFINFIKEDYFADVSNTPIELYLKLGVKF